MTQFLLNDKILIFFYLLTPIHDTICVDQPLSTCLSSYYMIDYQFCLNIYMSVNDENNITPTVSIVYILMI